MQYLFVSFNVYFLHIRQFFYFQYNLYIDILIYILIIFSQIIYINFHFSFIYYYICKVTI